ncbi:hypothetical protein D3C81_1130650 [compost metagenome]
MGDIIKIKNAIKRSVKHTRLREIALLEPVPFHIQHSGGLCLLHLMLNRFRQSVLHKQKGQFTKGLTLIRQG